MKNKNKHIFRIFMCTKCQNQWLVEFEIDNGIYKFVKSEQSQCKNDCDSSYYMMIN